MVRWGAARPDPAARQHRHRRRDQSDEGPVLAVTPAGMGLTSGEITAERHRFASRAEDGTRRYQADVLKYVEETEVSLRRKQPMRMIGGRPCKARRTCQARFPA